MDRPVAAALPALRRLRRPAETAPRRWPTSTRTRDPRDRRRLRARPGAQSRRRVAAPRADRLPGRHDRQLHARRAARVPARAGRHAGPDDALLLGTDLVKDIDVLEAAYDDAAGRDGRVQPQRPARHQPRARAPTSTRSCSSTSPSSTRRTSGSRCGCAPGGRTRSASAALDLDVPFERGEELRTEISAKFTRERWRPTTRPPGSSSRAGSPTRTARFALTLARPVG